MAIKWIKEYDLVVGSGKDFNISILQDDEGNFASACLWYEGERLWKTSAQGGFISLQLEKRIGISEEDVYNQIKEWAEGKFGKDIQIIPKENKEFKNA